LLFELITGNVPFQGNDIETLQNNILKLKISWPRDINTDVKNLIMKILKLDPNSRLPLSEMLQHPFFTRYFPNAAQSLIKPDDNIKYRPFIVSKDDPKTWDPVIKGDNGVVNKPNSRGGSPKKNSKSPIKEKSPQKDTKEKCTPEKFKILKEKYANLEKEYNLLKNGGKTEDSDVEKLKNVLKEREEKVAQLVGFIKEKGQEGDNSNESYLKMKVDELEKENESLTDKVMRYEQFIKSQQGEGIENNLMELRDSMTNKERFSTAIEKLKSKINEEAERNLNEIIKEKEKEILKIKEVEKIRRQKEQKKFTAIINKYDKTLNAAEKENKELKAKLKTLIKIKK
jgi:serine/threonine protein kinase